jgi:glutathione S-transferase
VGERGKVQAATQKQHHQSNEQGLGSLLLIPTPTPTPAIMETDALLHQQMPTAYRTLQPQASQHLHHGQPHLANHTLASQSGLDLSGLDDNDGVFHGDLHRLQTQSHPQVFHAPNGFDHAHGQGQRHSHSQPNGTPHTPQQHGGNAQFGVLTPASAQHNSISRLQQEDNLFGGADAGDQTSNGHLPTAIVPDPPNLAEWREKLFNVDDMITLSEDE